MVCGFLVSANGIYILVILLQINDPCVNEFVFPTFKKVQWLFLQVHDDVQFSVIMFCCSGEGCSALYRRKPERPFH